MRRCCICGLIFCGLPVLALWVTFFQHVHLSIGESRIPLALLIFSSVLNIFMDLWMVAGLGLGVFGAAFCNLDCPRHFRRIFLSDFFFIGCGDTRAHFNDLTGRGCNPCCKLPCCRFFSSLRRSIGMLIVQAVVNPFGTQALAGYSATMRVENVFSLIFVSIGNAVSPFVSKPWRRQAPTHQKGTTLHWCRICALQPMRLASLKRCTRRFPRCSWERRNGVGLSGVW